MTSVALNGPIGTEKRACRPLCGIVAAELNRGPAAHLNLYYQRVEPRQILPLNTPQLATLKIESQNAKATLPGWLFHFQRNQQTEIQFSIQHDPPPTASLPTGSQLTTSLLTR
jgi:hypothetical protein